MQKIERVRELDSMRGLAAIAIVKRPILKLKHLFPYESAAVHPVAMAGELAPIRGMETG